MFLLIRDDDVGFLRAVVAVYVSGNGFRLDVYVSSSSRLFTSI